MGTEASARATRPGGLVAGPLHSDLLEIVARDGVESAFEEAREAVAWHPGWPWTTTRLSA